MGKKEEILKKILEKFESHWFRYLFLYTSLCIGTTWLVCIQTRVEPKDDIIKLMAVEKEELLKQRDELREKVRLLAGELKKSRGGQPDNIGGPQNGSEKTLEISGIFYKSPQSSKFAKISPTARVQSGGEISFEITLPKPGGFLLIYSKDSGENLVNLFPGTKEAVINGAYRVPYVLDNPTTEIHMLTARSSSFEMLLENKIQTPVYRFDKKPGKETIYFYYSHERNKNIEAIIIGARNTRENISKVRGFLNLARPFDQQIINAKIEESILYSNVLKLSLIHE
jgi:hypothetical protein